MGRNGEKTQCCNQKWCVGDPCGIICAVITWLLILYGEVCVVSVMMWSWKEYTFHQTVNFLFFQCFAFLAFLSHVKTMLTDPGAVPKGLLTEDALERLQNITSEVIYRCKKCCTLKPERAHHCSVCERCIRRMDHHCPWVNNCVGENNQKYFVLFTMYIALLSLHALYWGIWQFVLCVNDNWRTCSAFGPPATTILLHKFMRASSVSLLMAVVEIFLLFESILFSIFTCVMFGTQISSICSDETAVESLKSGRGDGTGHERRMGWKNLQLVFGGPFSMRWLNPLVAPYVSRPSFEYSV